jgi:hypothetical protein
VVDDPFLRGAGNDLVGGVEDDEVGVFEADGAVIRPPEGLAPDVNDARSGRFAAK